MKSDIEIIKQVKRDIKKAKAGLSSQYEHIRKCRSFYSGDYMDYKDKIQFETPNGKKRATVRINKIKPTINALKGFFAQNRRKPKYIAQMNNNQMQSFYSKYANTVSMYLRANCNAEQIETQQDGDLLIAGIGAVETALTYGEGYASRSSDGELEMEVVDLDNFWWDATAKKSGLLDARFMGVTKKFDLDEALSLFNSEEEDFETSSDNEEEGYTYKGDIGSYDRIKYDYHSQKENIVNVHFYQCYDIEKYYRADNPLRVLNNPMAQEAATIELESIAQEIEDEDFDPRAEILSFGSEVKARLESAFGEFIEVKEFKRKCYYTYVTSGDKVFSKVKSIHQDGFSIKVKTGDYDHNNKIWTGVVSSMMEPQKYYDKALTELMFVIAANSKGGVIIEQDAVDDVQEFEDTYAKTDAICYVRSGAVSGGKIRDKRSPFQPTGYEQVIQFADTAIQDVTGVDKVFLGSSENKMESAALQRQRIRQVVSTMACYVDSIMLYTKEHARLMLDLMRIYVQNNRGALIRMVGDDVANQFIMLSEDKLSPEYEVIIEEALVTPEEKAEISSRITAIANNLMLAGDVQTAKGFYALALDYEAIDDDDKKKAKALLVPTQPPIDPNYVKQLETTIQQLQGVMSKAQLEKIMSDVALNKAKVQLTRADVQEKAANTEKIIEEAQQKNIENVVMNNNLTNPAKVSVNI